MKEKDYNKGDVYEISGIVLMAYKFGISASVELSDTFISDEIFEYYPIFEESPKINWILNHNNSESVDKNRQAVLFQVALICGKFIGQICNPDSKNEDYIFWDEVLDQQKDNGLEVIADFLEWYGKDECEAEDLARYLQNIFYEVARKNEIEKLIPCVADAIMLNGGSIDAPEIHELASSAMPIGILEFDSLPFYQAWNNALNKMA
jgi:hypothetical protein